MIVLAIIAGLAALAWPSLSRPMADSTVRVAAGQLVTEIAYCRRRAAMSGQLLLMRIDAKQSRIRSGSWQMLVQDAIENSDRSGISTSPPPTFRSTAQNDGMAGRAASAFGNDANPEWQAVRDWELPDGVVVDEVRWPEVKEQSRSELSAADMSRAGSSVAINANEVSRAEDVQPTPELVFEEEPKLGQTLAEGKHWYLPMTPDGRTRDVGIVLLDPATGTRVLITVDAATGLTQVEKL